MRKLLLLSILSLNALTACVNPEKKEHMSDNQVFYVGTYTHGDSEGIYKFFLNDTGKLDAKGLVAKAENPSFLTFSHDRLHLLSIGETDKKNGGGTVMSYTISNDTLLPVAISLTNGAHPCHVAVNSNGYIITSNYSGGNISLFQLQEDGLLSNLLDLKQHEGKGTNESRQKGPHAHSAWFVPNSNKVISCDLGTDELWIYELDEKNNKLVPAKQAKLKMNDGAGPRHLCFHPTKPWIYVVNELDCTVSLIKINKEKDYYHECSISTLPKDFTKQNTCADIHISNDGKFLYASNRGHNSIAMFSVNQDNGTIIPIGHQSAYGQTPRNFALSPNNKFLLVANQDTHSIIAFKRNETTGLLTICDEISVPNPVCIKFL